MLKHFWQVAISAILIAPLASHANDTDAMDWIRKMANAVHAVNYQGTFVYLHDNQLESMQIFHAVDGGKEREQLISLSGAAREVIRDKDSVICVLPENKTVSVSRRQADLGIRSLLPLNLEQLSAYYDFRILGEDRVAGRPVTVILVMPRDGYRYGYRLSLDTQEALPLKTDMLDEDGYTVAQFMFTTLQIDPILSNTSSLLDTAKSEGYTWIQQESAVDISGHENSPWQFHQLPAGFNLQVRTSHGGTEESDSIEHFVFSDGLAMLSVYVEQVGEGIGLDGESRMGAVNVYGAKVAGHQVTVVGEVPAQTVRQIATSLEYMAAGMTP